MTLGIYACRESSRQPSLIRKQIRIGSARKSLSNGTLTCKKARFLKVLSLMGEFSAKPTLTPDTIHHKMDRIVQAALPSTPPPPYRPANPPT
ncbi:MAG: hypothetical protein WCP62_11600, partial [Planctomycetota bacterium]